MNKKKTIEKQTQIFSSFQSLSLETTIYYSENSKCTLLYFHGGGFFFGERDDLPQTYIQRFLEAGFSLCTFDYPLSPEATLQNIFEVAQNALRWFLSEGWQLTGAISNDYILFGRSAGGYLATLLTAHFPHKQQKGLIRFYGYQDMLIDDFTQPSIFYNQFPKIPPLEAQSKILKEPIKKGSLETRFTLYLSARQYGNWINYLGGRSMINSWKISSDQFFQFPPVFLAHCRKDPDVPFQCSVELSEKLAHHRTFWLPLSKHDFDRQVNEVADQCYQKLLFWLSDILSL